MRLSVQARGVQTYGPEKTVRVRWTDRVQQTRRPLFPGYVFVRATPAELRTLTNINGIVGALPSNMDPQAITDEDLDTIRRLEFSGFTLEPLEALEAFVPGARVRIERGPLAGIEGVIERSGRRRLVVQIESFGGRCVAVELTPADIGACG